MSLYPRTSCYHTAFTPQAVCVEGRLYVLGINSTEPDVLYFRSTQIDSTQPEPETEASTAEAVTTETAPSAETESVETTAAPSAEEQSTDPAAAASEPPAEETFPTETRDAETEPAAQTGTNSWILWCVIGAAAAVIAVLIVRKKRQGGE